MPGEGPDAQYTALVSRRIPRFLAAETDEGYGAHSLLLSICHTGCSPTNRPTAQGQGAISQQLLLRGIESPLTGDLGHSGGHPWDPIRGSPLAVGSHFSWISLVTPRRNPDSENSALGCVRAASANH